jgi:hypothetical protein
LGEDDPNSGTLTKCSASDIDADSAMTDSSCRSDSRSTLGRCLPPNRGWLAQTAAHAGDHNRARVLSYELEQATKPQHRGSLTYARARTAAALGERDRALQLLRDAFAEGLEHGPHVHQIVDFEILRGYEPYERLLRPAG